MNILSKLVISVIISVCTLVPLSAHATLLVFHFTVDGGNVDATWEQDSAPTPINFSDPASGGDGHTLVPISNFVWNGSTLPAYAPPAPWTDMSYYLASVGGGLSTPAPAYSFFPSPTTQLFSGSLSAPVFPIPTSISNLLVYTGTEFNTSSNDAKLTIALAPVVGAPGPVPGAGLAGLAALALAGLYTRTRRA